MLRISLALNTENNVSANLFNHRYYLSSHSSCVVDYPPFGDYWYPSDFRSTDSSWPNSAFAQAFEEEEEAEDTAYTDVFVLVVVVTRMQNWTGTPFQRCPTNRISTINNKIRMVGIPSSCNLLVRWMSLRSRQKFPRKRVPVLRLLDLCSCISPMRDKLSPLLVHEYWEHIDFRDTLSSRPPSLVIFLR